MRFGATADAQSLMLVLHSLMAAMLTKTEYTFMVAESAITMGE